MRRKVFGLLSALAGLGMCTAAASAGAAPTFVAGGKLVVCVDPTFPPMEYMESTESKEPVGFDIDLITALSGAWKVEKELVALDFSGLLPALEAKRCDMMISGATLKPERLEKFGGTPYLKTGNVIMGKADATGSYASYGDFSGKTLAMQAGTIFEKIIGKANEELKAANKTEITVQTYPKGNDVVQQVLLGRVDGGVTLDSEFAFRELQQPGQMKILFADPEKEQYAAYFRKEPAGDQAAVDSAIAELLSSGMMKAITEKWHIPASAVEGVGK
ncbi:MAG: transporter substrate-binding domain-containing protein [Hyphomicrobiales bacterium]|nr:transporter substrate-binding domain-containing protein [Hyphomicrobiales bacterium]